MERIALYGAGPLSNIADRHHNLLLERELTVLGYLVILPQKEAVKRFSEGRFDLMGVCEDCEKLAISTQVIVANIDGVATESGVASEIGMARATKILAEMFQIIPWKPIVICVRTDSKTSLDKEIGYTAMFQKVDKLIYKPAYANSLEEVAVFYKELAQEIDRAIKEILTKRASNR